MFYRTFVQGLIVSLLATVVGTSNVYANEEQAKYEASWASLDQRQSPQWWSDAKFGIFIHWGLYAVPSYSPVGTYAEWYWERINANGKGIEGDSVISIPDSDKVYDYHKENYGKDFKYEQFAKDFKAELFSPEQWANVFKRSGAKYVVLTSKHHEGYTLWPSKEADKTWGKPWNALTTGPKRDLAGDLTNAVRKAGLKMGFYYSVSEWYNPLYRKDVDAYVEQHMLPQLKDLVNRYNPDVLFSDGEWGHTSDTWKSKEFLAWLYNREQSSDVIVNDRWGSKTRHKHGGYYTTEYGAGLPDATYPWEESRGMGTSYGYNRNENIEDYSTAQSLVLTLIDTVSRGGNFLLNVGPRADGQLPVIMQERLLSIGNWLSKNGQAIYDTRVWNTPVQWGEGKTREVEVAAHGFVDYDIVEQTLFPKGGMAAKEVFFTRKDDKLYAIFPKWYENFTLRDIKLSKHSTARLLATDQKVAMNVIGNNVILNFPKYQPNQFNKDDSIAYVIEITGI